MRQRGSKAWRLAVLLLVAPSVHAEEKEPSTFIEIGGAGEWGLRHGGFSFGPNLGVEHTIIENWLEIEAGVTPLFAKGQAETGTDFFLKKPFELSKSLEFEAGGGVEWIHKVSGKPSDSMAGEAVVEFIYRPWQDKNFRLFLEPAYAYDFGKEHEQSLSVSGGLKIGI